MTENRGGEFITYREYIATREEINKRMGSIELEQATMRASLAHMPDDMRQLTASVNNALAKMQSTAPPQSEISLALHNAADAFRQAPRGGSSGLWAAIGALAAVAAILAWLVITKG